MAEEVDRRFSEELSKLSQSDKALTNEQWDEIVKPLRGLLGRLEKVVLFDATAVWLKSIISIALVHYRLFVYDGEDPDRGAEQKFLNDCAYKGNAGTSSNSSQ